ncbi:MAG: hypothetical protein A2W00_09980 [Candidatus Eisenbacteria bacterium RBG_16_71_46]|nr:MAG: hypothetical protein A2W00_09980 [Candidatus Eisenbacteria bacterium RBG_16_71_46]
MGEGHRTFDHTGDLGLEVWADTPERLYARAAEAVLAQTAEVGDDPPAERARIAIEGDDPADLLVAWLNRALLEAELRRAVWNRARVTALGPREVRGVLEGPRLDPRRHVLLREVKAVSYHDLELALEPGACRCRLVLDL